MTDVKEKHTCMSCIHNKVCEYSIYKAEIYCDDYINKDIILMYGKFFNEFLEIWNDCHTPEELVYLLSLAFLRCTNNDQ